MSLKLKGVECLGCGYESAVVYFESRYRGLRSRCPKCGGDFPES